MRQIVFKEVKLRNFKCHEELDFSFVPNRFVTIVGNNGAGKTTCMSALVWALYDQTIEGMTGDSVVRKRSGRNTSVEVTWSDGDDNYEVKAYRKHKTHSNSRYLYKNGVDITENKASETLDRIEQLLMPKDIFLNCLLFSKFVKNQFMDMTHSGQKEILDEMLLLSRFDEYYESMTKYEKHLKSEKDQAEEQLRSVDGELAIREQSHQSQITAARNEVASIQEKINKLNDELSEFKEMLQKQLVSKEDIELKEEKLQKIHEKISSLNNDLKNAEANRNTTIKELTSSFEFDKSALHTSKLEFSESLKSLEEEMSATKLKWAAATSSKDTSLAKLNNNILKARDRDKELRRAEVSPIEEEIREYRMTANSAKTTQELKRKAAEVPKKKLSEMSDSFNSENPVCVLCGQEIRNEEAKDHLEKEIEKLKKEILVEKKDYDEAVKVADKANEKIESLNILLDEINSKYDKVDSEREGKIEEATEKITQESSREIAKYESSYKSMASELKSKKEEFESEVLKKIAELEAKYNQDKDNLSKQFNSNIASLEAEIERGNSALTTTREELVILKSAIERAEKIKSYINEKMAMIEFAEESLKSAKNAEEKINLTFKETCDNINKKRVEIEKSVSEIATRCNLTSFWKEAFGDTGIKSILLDEAVPILNEKARELCELARDLKVRFTSQVALKSGEFRNKFGIDVVQTRNLSDLKELSAGERRMVDIIVLLSLRYLLEKIQDVRMNILLLDEILDSLDPENASIAVGMVKKLSESHCVVLISHTLRDYIEADETLVM